MASRIALDHLGNQFKRSGFFKEVTPPTYRPLPHIEDKIRLRELDELRATSSITPAEYERRRNEILDPY